MKPAPKQKKPRTFKVWVSPTFVMHDRNGKTRCAVVYFDKLPRLRKEATLTLKGRKG